MPAAEHLQRRADLRIGFERCEGIEVPMDQLRPAIHAKVGEGFGQRQFADLLVGPIRLPIVGDVPVLPMLPEGAHIDIGATALLENGMESGVGTVSHVDQRSDYIERKKLRA